MSLDSTLRLERTTLFELLIEKEKKLGGDHEISERVKAVVAHVAPLMERIPDKMPEYTLHDPNHGAKVVELMGMIIPRDTLELLNPIEISILIYAGYLHDLGMTCSTSEREKIIESDENFAQLLASDTTRLKKIELFKENSNHRAATHIEDQVFTEYLRRNHVKRSAKFIENELTNGKLEISWKGTPYWRLVVAVCDSHALPIRELRDTRRWPRDALIRNVRVNVQYLSLILRLGDILDLDPERTPKVIFDFVDPQDPVSIIEWNKHRSVLGWDITPERIQFDAECTDAVYERALREFINWIEIERSESVALASSYRDDLARLYHLDLTESVTSDRIRSNGTYIFSSLRFEVDHERVINLLMGERLYRNPELALRELIQNAFDAVRYRYALENREDNEFTPRIEIILDGNILSIEDNGVGMDRQAIENYFMQVGRSYYSSPQFRSQNLNIDIVSEFGIGVLSAFMVAEHLYVESRKRPDNPLNPPKPILIEIPTAHRYFVQRPSNRTKIGTKITLTLKDEHPFLNRSLKELIGRMVPFGEYPIHTNSNGEKFTFKPRSPQTSQLSENSDVIDFLIININSELEDELNGIFGEIRIVDSTGGYPRQLSRRSTIAQCGFSIGQSNDNYPYSNPCYTLFPEWTQVDANLDFRLPARLTLTPDRNNIVHDEKFEKIALALENLIIRSMRVHFAEQKLKLDDEDYCNYIDLLIEEGSLKGESHIGFALSNEAKQLLLDFIPFKCIDENGEFGRISGEEIASSETVIITDERAWSNDTKSKEIRNSVDAHFGKKYPIIVDHGKENSHREYLYNHLFSEVSGHFISSVPGVVVDLIEKNNSHLENTTVQGIVHFTFNLQAGGGHQCPVFVHSREVSSISFEYPTFNANHPLFLPILEELASDDLEESVKEIIIELQHQIVEIIEKSILLPHLNENRLIRKSRNKNFQIRDSVLMEAPNRVLRKILCRDNSIQSAIQACFIEYWDKMVEKGIIDKSKKMPNLTTGDLPWFWGE